MVTVLFGSGADSDFCNRLPSGAAFMEPLLKNEYESERKQLFKESQGKYSNIQLIHSNSRKIFIKTIIEHEEEAKKAFANADELIKKCKTYYSDAKDNDDDKKYIQNKCSEWVNLLKNRPDKLNKEFDFFFRCAEILNVIDGKFNALRLPELNNDAWKVINAYWIIYILMLKKIYGDDEGNICFNGEKIEWDYKNIFDFLTTQDLTKYYFSSEETYYSLLYEYGPKAKVVTTNYTRFAEIGTRVQDVIYLHGKMTWFEDLKMLTIFDVESEAQKKQLCNLIDENPERSHFIIPFILIPSGVKPIICQKQIEEFHRFIECLNDSNYLLVVGYRFNSEDNHINSIIADWLRSSNVNAKHKLIYLNYKNSVNPYNLSWLTQSQGEDIKRCTSESWMENWDQSVVFIDVDREQCKNVYKEILKKLK